MAIPDVYPYGDITLFEIVPLIPLFITLALKLVLQIFTYPFSGRKHTLRRTLWRTFTKTVTSKATPRQMQWVIPRVGVAYERFAKRENMVILHEDIGDGATLHWIGAPNSEIVILFVHGGGYVLPAVDGHFDMANYFRKTISKNKETDVSIAFLEYSLVNHAPWPKQSQQVTAALSNLIRRGIPPSNIFLVGDSAGGHQLAFLLAHLIHPHPNAIPIKLTSPLGGAVLLSPWLSYDQATPSWKRNAEKDLVPPEILRQWSDILKTSRTTVGKVDDPFFEPGKASIEWWHGLENVVKNILVTAAMGECMVDDIVLSAEKMKEAGADNARVEIYVQPEGAHNEIMAEFACGDAPGPSTHRVTKWFEDVV